MIIRIVVIGELLFNRNADNYWGNRKDGYTLFENYKDNSVEEIMRSQEDGEFRDDLFSSYDEYMDFWGTNELCFANGSVYAKKYNNFTNEDKLFYQYLVDEADEENKWGYNEKKNIKIIKPNDWNAKRIEIRFIKSKKNEWKT